MIQPDPLILDKISEYDEGQSRFCTLFDNSPSMLFIILFRLVFPFK